MLVRYNKHNLYFINDKVKLKPGPQEIDPKLWAEARQEPGVQSRIESGVIVEEFDAEEDAKMSDKDHKEAVKGHLSTLKQNDAIALVKETIELSLLETWLAEEKAGKARKVLLQSIEKQIGVLKEEPQMRDRNQQRQIVTGAGPQVINVHANPSAIDD